MLIARGKAVAGFPVTDPLGRDVDERLAGFEGWPARRQRPGVVGQDTDEHVFGREDATSIVARPAQVLCDDPQEFLQDGLRGRGGRLRSRLCADIVHKTILSLVAKSGDLSLIELRAVGQARGESGET